MVEFQMDPRIIEAYRKRGWSQERIEKLLAIAREQAKRIAGRPDLAPEKVFPVVLPVGWQIVDRAIEGRAYFRRTDALRVICTVGYHSDGRFWAHVSASYADRLPSYKVMREVKDLFIGRDRKAINVFPPAAEHVNIHEYTHHLFSCLDGDPLPDFTEGTGSI